MKDVVIVAREDGGTVVLTTKCSTSSHGASVLRINNIKDMAGDYGPADIIDSPTGLMAAEIVDAWVNHHRSKRTEEEITAATIFLRQWPEGPQV